MALRWSSQNENQTENQSKSNMTWLRTTSGPGTGVSKFLYDTERSTQRFGLCQPCFNLGTSSDKPTIDYQHTTEEYIFKSNTYTEMTIYTRVKTLRISSQIKVLFPLQFNTACCYFSAYTTNLWRGADSAWLFFVPYSVLLFWRNAFITQHFKCENVSLSIPAWSGLTLSQLTISPYTVAVNCAQ